MDSGSSCAWGTESWLLAGPLPLWRWALWRQQQELEAFQSREQRGPRHMVRKLLPAVRMQKGILQWQNQRNSRGRRFKMPTVTCSWLLRALTLS